MLEINKINNKWPKQVGDESTRYNYKLLKRFMIKDSFLTLAEINSGLFTVMSDLIPLSSFYNNYTDALKDFYSLKKEIKKYFNL